MNLKDITKGQIIYGENQNYKVIRLFREQEDEIIGKDLFIQLAPYDEPVVMPE